MTDPVKEQLSACLDGELPEGELDLLLKQASRDSQSRAALGRYALIGDALRGQGIAAAPADFAARVAAAIAVEPSLTTSSTRLVTNPPRWLRPAAGVAVAAGVAAIAILAVQRPQGPAGVPYAVDASPSASIAANDIPETASYIVPANTANGGIVPPARLTNYVVAHSEYSTPLGRRSVLSSVLAEEGANADVAFEVVDREDLDGQGMDSESTEDSIQR